MERAPAPPQHAISKDEVAEECKPQRDVRVAPARALCYDWRMDFDGPTIFDRQSLVDGLARAKALPLDDPRRAALIHSMEFRLKAHDDPDAAPGVAELRAALEDFPGTL